MLSRGSFRAPAPENWPSRCVSRGPARAAAADAHRGLARGRACRRAGRGGTCAKQGGAEELRTPPNCKKHLTQQAFRTEEKSYEENFSLVQGFSSAVLQFFDRSFLHYSPRVFHECVWVFSARSGVLQGASGVLASMLRAPPAVPRLSPPRCGRCAEPRRFAAPHCGRPPRRDAAGAPRRISRRRQP